MNWLKAVVTTLGPRGVGLIVSGVCGWIFHHSKGTVQIDEATVVKIALEQIGEYAAAHRLASSYINPGDAAKLRLSQAMKEATDTGAVVAVKPSTSK